MAATAAYFHWRALDLAANSPRQSMRQVPAAQMGNLSAPGIRKQRGPHLPRMDRRWGPRLGAATFQPLVLPPLPTPLRAPDAGFLAEAVGFLRLRMVTPEGIR